MARPRPRASLPVPGHHLTSQAPPAAPPAHAQGTSPIYNLLPDILSNLSREPRLGKAQFQSIMQQVRQLGWCVCVGAWRPLTLFPLPTN